MKRCFGLIWLLAGTMAAQTPLANQVQTLVAEPAVARAHWGVSVVGLDGAPIYQLNDAQFFQPASNAKLFTTAAAMALLGPEKTFQTKVVGQLDPATGVVKGDLTIIGGGDPGISGVDLPYAKPDGSQAKPDPLRYLAAMADQVAAKGVKAITGDVVGDDTLFPWEPYETGWETEDMVWGYGARATALSAADNELKLTITPGLVKDHESYAATVTLDQAVPYYTVEGHVSSFRATSGGMHAGGVQVERVPGSRVLRVYGEIAANAAPDVEEIAIDDPAEYVAMTFRAMLLARGITVAGTSRAQHRLPQNGVGFLAGLKAKGPEDLTVAGGEGGGSCLTPFGPAGTVLAERESAPLAEDVVFTNKTSQNLHAEMLLRHLGRRVFCGQGSTLAGARLVRAFLLHAGIDPDDFVFYDGSGLSGHDLVTPRATTQLLVYATAQPWFAAWKASLPIGGVDGSLAGRFTDAPLKGKVFAKTGTLGEARALSGYVVCASGRTVAFAVMVSNHAPGGSADRVVMDKIVGAIAAAL